MEPTKKPQLKTNDLLVLLKKEHPNYTIPDFFIFGIRGYYKRSMGNPLKNDRNIYDDAIGIYIKGVLHMFNGNVDPSAFRKTIANLVPGIYNSYKFDIHSGSKQKYPAICQRYDTVKVLRDNVGLDEGMFGINIHRGGYKNTSSLGCQTIPPSQWNDFYETAKKIAIDLYKDKWNSTKITYILLEN